MGTVRLLLWLLMLFPLLAGAQPLVLQDRGRTVTFPLGAASFADEVVLYRIGGKPPSQPNQKPSLALGPPPLVGKEGKSVSLGSGGELILRFRDKDVPGADLYVFEIGPDVEAMFVSISSDGQSWISVGRLAGSTCSVDIAPFIATGQSFGWVRLGGGGSCAGSLSEVAAALLLRPPLTSSWLPPPTNHPTGDDLRGRGLSRFAEDRPPQNRVRPAESASAEGP